MVVFLANNDIYYNSTMAKILLAEDDLFLRDVYTETFRDEGFDITTAVDGEEALQKLKEGNWDLVLLDVVMPKKSGIEVLKEIKVIPDKTYAKHIVFMTNSDEKKDLEEVLDMTDGFLLKTSYTPAELVEKVKEYLES
jgi:CheY-like chemotaxis protein